MSNQELTNIQNPKEGLIGGLALIDPAHESSDLSLDDLISSDAIPQLIDVGFEIFEGSGTQLMISEAVLRELEKGKMSALTFRAINSATACENYSVNLDICKAVLETEGIEYSTPLTGVDVLHSLTYIAQGKIPKGSVVNTQYRIGAIVSSQRILDQIHLGPHGKFVSDIFGDYGVEILNLIDDPIEKYSYTIRLIHALASDFLNQESGSRSATKLSDRVRKNYPVHRLFNLILNRYGFLTGLPSNFRTSYEDPYVEVVKKQEQEYIKVTNAFRYYCMNLSGSNRPTPTDQRLSSRYSTNITRPTPKPELKPTDLTNLLREAYYGLQPNLTEYLHDRGIELNQAIIDLKASLNPNHQLLARLASFSSQLAENQYHLEAALQLTSIIPQVYIHRIKKRNKLGTLVTDGEMSRVFTVMRIRAGELLDDRIREQAHQNTNSQLPQLIKKPSSNGAVIAEPLRVYANFDQLRVLSSIKDQRLATLQLMFDLQAHEERERYSMLILSLGLMNQMLAKTYNILATHHYQSDSNQLQTATVKLRIAGKEEQIKIRCFIINGRIFPISVDDCRFIVEIDDPIIHKGNVLPNNSQLSYISPSPTGSSHAMLNEIPLCVKT